MLNRELKFRIWDPKAGNWFWKPDELGNIIYCDDWDMFDPYDYQFDQFTGLKDKNGKEIYEGDIVKYQHLDDSYQHLLIKWLDADCMFDAGGYRIDLVAHRGEVIGNIHEDSQLLAEDK